MRDTCYPWAGELWHINISVCYITGKQWDMQDSGVHWLHLKIPRPHNIFSHVVRIDLNSSRETERGCLFSTMVSCPWLQPPSSTYRVTGFRTERSLEFKSRLYQSWDHRQSLSIPGPQFTSLYNEVIRPNDLRTLSRSRILWYSWWPDSELVLLYLCSPSDGMMRPSAQHQANNIWPWAPTALYTAHLHHHPPHREKTVATQKLRKAFLHDQVSIISLNFQRNSIF